MTKRSSSGDSNHLSELESGHVSSRGSRGDSGDCFRCGLKCASRMPGKTRCLVGQVRDQVRREGRGRPRSKRAFAQVPPIAEASVEQLNRSTRALSKHHRSPRHRSNRRTGRRGLCSSTTDRRGTGRTVESVDEDLAKGTPIAEAQVGPPHRSVYGLPMDGQVTPVGE